MNARRNEEPLTTADIANRESSTRNAVIDETDDTYDGEVVSSTPGEPQNVAAAAQSNARDAVDRDADGDLGQTRAADRSNVSTPAVNPPVDARPTNRATDVRPATPTDDNRATAPLFAENELRDFRSRWDQVQTSFVDEPRHAVEQADTLVATVVKRIAEQFAEERAKLEKQWDRGDNVSTEDLRQGFKRYRAFFDRLLSF
jgi:hypothetical protein